MCCNAVIVLLVLWVSLIDSPIEKGWKGIEVFKSTRADVEHHLGKPFKDEGVTWYRKEGVVVSVLYSTLPCTPASYGRGRFNIPRETVINYSVALGKGIPLSKLEWAKADYERWVNDHRPGQVEYFNSKAGVRFTSIANEEWGEVVGNFEFERTKELEEKYKCN